MPLFGQQKSWVGFGFETKRLVSLEVLTSIDCGGPGVTRSGRCLHFNASEAGRCWQEGWDCKHASSVGSHFKSTDPCSCAAFSEQRHLQHRQGYHLIVLLALFRGLSMYKGHTSNGSIILVPLGHCLVSAVLQHCVWSTPALTNG